MTDKSDGIQQPQNDPAALEADFPSEIEAERDAQFELEEFFARRRATHTNSNPGAGSSQEEGTASPYHELDV